MTNLDATGIFNILAEGPTSLSDMVFRLFQESGTLKDNDRIATIRAIELGMVGFVRGKLTAGVAVTAKDSDAAGRPGVSDTNPDSERAHLPLLYYALCQPFLSRFEFPISGSLCPQIVQLLLDSGADPNERCLDKKRNREITPWRSFLSIMRRFRRTELGVDAIGSTDTVIKLIDGGADLSAAEQEIGTSLKDFISREMSNSTRKPVHDITHLLLRRPT